MSLVRHSRKQTVVLRALRPSCEPITPTFKTAYWCAGPPVAELSSPTRKSTVLFYRRLHPLTVLHQCSFRRQRVEFTCTTLQENVARKVKADRTLNDLAEVISISAFRCNPLELVCRIRMFEQCSVMCSLVAFRFLYERFVSSSNNKGTKQSPASAWELFCLGEGELEEERSNRATFPPSSTRCVRSSFPVGKEAL